jgi:GT2 family glycosyltransferase
MENTIVFDALIVVTPADCKRLLPLYPRLISNFTYGKICFIGAPEVGEIALNDPRTKGHSDWVDENSLIPFDEVHKCMTQRLESVLKGKPLARAVTGWYYQQFLKMQYAFACENEYYMVWDGDTVPCRPINMFSPETGQPYLDLKHEYHAEYFDTMGKILPGFGKVIERSFISEHMLMRCDIMKSLIHDIEQNDSIPGTRFWEKIINSIEPNKIFDSSFSEFETYGTYVALRSPNVYKLREWHSFRLGASFFDMNTICDRDFEWLGKDFDAISFEKGQKVREDNRNFFDNPEYQSKLSAKKMLQLAQMEYKDGYKEIWEDDIQNSKNANVNAGGFYLSEEKEERVLIVINHDDEKQPLERCIESIRDALNPKSYIIALVENAIAGKEKYAFAEGHDDVIIVSSNERLEHGAACNLGVKASENTEYKDCDVFLLDCNCVLLFDTLYFLKQALYAAPDVGAVGSVSNCADNKQRIDVDFETEEEYIKYGAKVNIPMNDPCLERVCLSSYSMLVRRDLWNEIGGFNEDYPEKNACDRLFSLEVLKRGKRLMVVRNSYIYNSRDAAAAYNSESTGYADIIRSEYGFDFDKYCMPGRAIITSIPYDGNARFAVLDYGCGLGSELKAIRSLYPNSEIVGVETDPKLFNIVKKTEKVLESLDELMEFYEDETFDVLIIDKTALDMMDEEEKKLVSGLLKQSAVTMTRER